MDKLLICPGLPRCGSTSLYYNYLTHGNFNMPFEKESAMLLHTNCVSKYKRNYQTTAEDKCYLDFSPQYSLYPDLFLRNLCEIKKSFDIRIIINSRDPIQLAYSLYTHRIRSSGLKYFGFNYPFTFETAESNFYDLSSLIESISSVIDRKNLFLIDLEFDPQESLDRLADFVNVSITRKNFNKFSGGWLPSLYYSNKNLITPTTKPISLSGEFISIRNNALLIINRVDSIYKSYFPEKLAEQYINHSQGWTRAISYLKFANHFSSYITSYKNCLDLFGYVSNTIVRTECIETQEPPPPMQIFIDDVKSDFDVQSSTSSSPGLLDSNLTFPTYNDFVIALDHTYSLLLKDQSDGLFSKYLAILHHGCAHFGMNEKLYSAFFDFYLKIEHYEAFVNLITDNIEYSYCIDSNELIDKYNYYYNKMTPACQRILRAALHR